MPNLFDYLLYKLCSDPVKILLDRMDINQEAFNKYRSGVWSSTDRAWLDLALTGTFSPFENLVIKRKLRKLNLRFTQERILSVLMGNA